MRFSAATSRASPAMLRQSPRFGVSPSSMTWSSSASSATMSSPTGASAGNSSRPSTRLVIPSSSAEHSMPQDSTPRSLARLIFSPGSSAPSRAKGTRSPARTLLAPQTTWYSPRPSETRQTLRRSAFG